MNINQERGNVIMHRLEMNDRKLQQRLKDIQRQIVESKQRLLPSNPNWNIQRDIRVTSLNNLAAIVARTRLEIEFLGELLDDDWWEAHFSESLPDETKIAYAVGFERTIKYSFGMDFFGGIETSLRAFLRALDPNACKSGTGAFTNIYECLFGSNQLAFSTPNREATIELLNFVRLIRNLIHNSGVYFADDGTNQEQIYKGSSYRFYHGRPVDFVTWDLLLTLAVDIHSLLLTVITHPMIIGLNEIVDPFIAHM